MTARAARSRTGSDWSARQYLKFEDERSRPAHDLLLQVPALPRDGAQARIVDLGCGPGNSTELLAYRYPQARLAGIDNSPDMLAEARRRLPAVDFIEADLAGWLPDADHDLVYANAVYQWLPDHPALLARVLAALKPGAVLAVQMPDNLGEPTHRLMTEVARAGPWAHKLTHAARAPLPAPRHYYDLLAPHAARLDLFHIVYNHALCGPEAVVEWVQGTGLRPFLDPLDAAERAEFLARYAARIGEAYPRARDGKVLLRFPRLFIVAQRGRSEGKS